MGVASSLGFVYSVYSEHCAVQIAELTEEDGSLARWGRKFGLEEAANAESSPRLAKGTAAPAFTRLKIPSFRPQGWFRLQ